MQTRFAPFQYGYKKTGRINLPIGEKGIWPTAFPFCSPQGPLQICGSLKRSLCFLFFFVSLLHICKQGLQRFSMDTKKPEDLIFRLPQICGEKGIRTPGTFPFNGFQDRRIRPLCHLSFPIGIAKVDKIFNYANKNLRKIILTSQAPVLEHLL